MNRSRPLPSVRAGLLRILPPVPAGAGFTLLGLVLLAGIEFAARTTLTDIQDGFLFLALALLALLVSRRHERAPLPWVPPLVAAARSAGAWVKRETVDLGVDLRGAPPVPRGFPPLFGSFVGVLTAASVLLAAFPSLDPASVRDGVRPFLATAWVVGVGASWALFVVGGVYLVFVTLALVHDGLVHAWTGRPPRPLLREVVIVAAIPLALLAAVALLPPWLPALLAALLLLGAVVALGFPVTGDLLLLWKSPRGSTPLRATPWTTHNLASLAGLALLVAVSVLFVQGPGAGAASGRDLASFPMTDALVTGFGWAGTAALCAWCVLLAQAAWIARFRNPAHPAPTNVRLEDDLDEGVRWAATAVLEDAGMRVRPRDARPSPTDVRLVLDAGGADHRDGAVHVATRDLPTREALWRVQRRDEIQRRRILVRGLQGLFKRAAGRTFRAGHGFWVAPQHWFCIALSRDEDEPVRDTREGTVFLGTIGPAYHRVLPQPARQHLHRMLADLEIDLMFVEDGVGFRRFRRVLRMIFEIHDMLGGRRRAEELHFTGLPGVRCIIHVFEIDDPARAKRKGYPEPDYETIGRARILHVFKDRGEAEEPVTSPADWTGQPVLV